MLPLTNFSGSFPSANFGSFNSGTAGYGFPTPGLNSTPMMGMDGGFGMGQSVDPMTSMMGMMMNSVMQMLQGVVGAGQAGGAMSPSSDFGAMGGPGAAGGLNDFLGGGAGMAKRKRRAKRAPRGGGGGTPQMGGSAPQMGGGAPQMGGGGGGGGVPSAGGGGSTPSAPSGGSTSSSGGTSSSPGVTADLPNGVQGLTFAKAAELVKKGGGQVNPGGKPTVLALRSETSASSGYKDAFVVLKPDGTLERFSASTRPTSNGQDRAMLKPGAYDITPRWRDGKYNNDAFLVQKNGSNNVGVGRDSNGDGKWSQGEMNANTSSDLIRLHRGNSTTTSSTGCLNVQDYDGFLKSVGGRDSNFNLVLVNLK